MGRPRLDGRAFDKAGRVPRLGPKTRARRKTGAGPGPSTRLERRQRGACPAWRTAPRGLTCSGMRAALVSPGFGAQTGRPMSAAPDRRAPGRAKVVRNVHWPLTDDGAGPLSVPSRRTPPGAGPAHQIHSTVSMAQEVVA